jgi:hypothetical protein
VAMVPVRPAGVGRVECERPHGRRSNPITARARRAMGHTVVLIDPFAITGTAGHALNWLDTLDSNDPDVVSHADSEHIS